MLQANSILIAFSLGRECIRCLKSFVIELDPNSTPLNMRLYVIKVLVDTTTRNSYYINHSMVQ